MKLYGNLAQSCLLAGTMLVAGVVILAPVTVTAEVDHAQRTHVLDTAIAGKAKGPVTGATFVLDSKLDPKDVRFALLAHGVGIDPRPEFILNGTRVDMMPAERPEGVIVRLPWWLMQVGENRIELQTEAGNPLAADRLQIFNLLDPFEESHFDRAFARPSGFSTEKAQPTPHPSQPNVDALHYDLDITTDMSNTVISGILTFTGKSLVNGLDQFALDFHPNFNSSLGVDRMVVSTVDTGPSTSALSYTIDRTNRKLIVSLPTTVNMDETFSLRVVYGGTPSTGGTFGAPFVRSTHGSPATPIIYTFSEPYGARNWWPCKDLPDDKATIDIHVTAPKPYTVVTNGQLVSKDDLGANERWNYSHGYPIPTYLVSICITNYVFGSTTYTGLGDDQSLTVGHYVLPQNAFELDGAVGTLEAMEFMTAEWGEYPYMDEKYVTATHLSGSGMEHTTNTSMPPGDVGPVGGYPAGLGRRNIHELAHHWFGDMVTCKSFNHLWLNEGFATYAEPAFYEWKYGIAAYHAYVAGWASTGVSTTVALVNNNADAFAGSVVYRRGGTVLHILRGIIGKEVLHRSMKKFTERFAYDVAETDDFRQVVEEESGLDLEAFFDQWVYSPGRPNYSYSYTQSGTPGNHVLELTINQTQNSPMPTVYTMPIQIEVESINGTRQTFTVQNTLRNQSFSIPIGALDAWIVRFDPENWIFKTVTNSGAAPRPIMKSATAVISGGNSVDATITWEAGVGTSDSFQVLLSEDELNWSIAADVASPATQALLTGLDPDQTYYVRMRANRNSGTPSELSYTLAFRASATADRVLIVDGYDRWPTQSGRPATHNFSAVHGRAIGASNIAFDACNNEVVEDGIISLIPYDAAFWILGEESTVTNTFTSTERGLVTAYMDAGGKLFLSGAEIGYELDRSGSSTSQRSFYNNVLKSQYLADRSDIYTVTGLAGTVFEGKTYNFDNDGTRTYLQVYADVIAPFPGSDAALGLNYEGSAGALVLWGAPVKAGLSTNGRLMNMGFAFETIYPEADQTDFMEQVVLYFGLQGTQNRLTDSFLLY